ncbi:hypothetical protein [Piscinibacter gummiphilus]|uniref:Uncharacterized protein n=1 Tax=Piscinibacter gummiphilus TaxID=946333 RepID=A0ABZ0D8N2_9BURK|nr:hypothetical protein [Piscinibacter gummiphilus]WOB11353.1 hypothetical protein RXV79_28135 [Piscinibacter gummiphilus]
MEIGKDVEKNVETPAKKEAELTAAEASLSDLKAKVNVKLGPIPFIAGLSNKARQKPW